MNEEYCDLQHNIPFVPEKSLKIRDALFSYLVDHSVRDVAVINRTSDEPISPIQVSGHHRRTCLGILFLIFLTLPIMQAGAEGAITQFWFDFNPSARVTDRLTVYGKIGIRTTAPYSWTRYLITPSVKYNWPRLILRRYKYKEEFHGGIGFFFTDNKDYSNHLEIRPFQGYSLSAPNSRIIVINHFLMLEERFEISTADWVNTFGLRLRYKASITLRFHGDIWSPGDGFYLPVSCEFFWNLIGTKQFNDKIRIVGGLGYDFPNQWKTAVLFGYNLSRDVENEDFNNHDMLLRLRVYYNIN